MIDRDTAVIIERDTLGITKDMLVIRTDIRQSRGPLLETRGTPTRL